MPTRRRRLSRSTPPAASTPGKKRKRHYNARLSEVKTLLYPRAFTAKRLNCSIATVLRMEQAGTLDVIRLNPNSPAAQVYHKAAQVDALAQGEKA